MEVYEGLYFKDIFPEDALKKYLRGLEKIWNKSEKCNTEIDSTGYDLSDYFWVYTRKVSYFLEDNKNVNGEMKDKNSMKKESSVNPYNLKEKKINSEVLENGLIDHH